ncbi:hypothetical protein FOA43_003628 [Brettanomyces nanus]|uniref:Dolichyl-phosphate-mannose--protein mannosyltransferase n=1 Tax=Eeniella nana TaxID=13502 RepID=A0A875S8M8_EENNA|nr:uncharacterized protein FOA43_003628 [Brettanomyces nanus]QPG76242.1 hypothetical protein FOA43_003628 [Brettanomyces nanus]
MAAKPIELNDEPDTQFSSEKGPLRAFVSRKTSSVPLQINVTEKIHLLLLLIVAIAVRRWNIAEPPSVVFDESIVGKSINNYLTHAFSLDTDPPAVKLLYTWLVELCNYVSPTFNFNTGESYLNSESQPFFPYTVTRGFSSLLGGCTILFTYRTLRASDVRHYIALFGAFIVAFENSISEQSRFMFVDSPMLFFIAFAVSMIKTLQNSRAFSRKWLSVLFLSGISLGFVISSRVIGIFTLIWAILVTIKETWFDLGDLRLKTSFVMKTGFSKLTAFLTIPFTIYLFFFFIHLNILTNKGPGYGKMSPEFERGLAHNHLSNLIEEVSYGSDIMLRNFHSGQYLHSYNGTYPNGHQQITLVDDYQDEENLWFVEERVKALGNELLEKLKPIRNGKTLRLFHKNTKAFLRIHESSKPALSEQDYNKEASALGNDSWTGDDFADFEVKIASDYCKTEHGKHTLKAGNTIFQLYNRKKSCYLLGTDKKLPEDWGHGQTEVICIESPTFVKSLWFVDYNRHPLFNEDSNTVDFKKLSFWEKFIETNNAMLKLFSENKFEHEYMSKPKEWIFLSRGIPYFVQPGKTIYLLGNLITYYLVAFSVIIFGLWELGKLITWNPNRVTTSSGRVYDYEFHGLDFFIGYLINLVPFYLMDQTVFLFHYIPALYFGILLVCQTFEFIVSRRAKVGYCFMLLWGVAILVTYIEFAPLIYGLKWTRQACERMLISPAWDNLCLAYAE